MNVINFISKLQEMFSSPIEIQEAIADTESNEIIKKMSIQDINDAIEYGSKFIKLTSLIRFHQEFVKRMAILDPEDPVYKGMDSKTLNHMMEDMSQLDPWIILQLIQEKENRTIKE